MFRKRVNNPKQPGHLFFYLRYILKQVFQTEPPGGSATQSLIFDSSHVVDFFLSHIFSNVFLK